MLLLEGYNSNFTCAKCDFLYIEFSDFYVNQSLAGQTIVASIGYIQGDSEISLEKNVKYPSHKLILRK
jgi:hypothetical protein